MLPTVQVSAAATAVLLLLSRPSHRRAACRGAGPLPCCTSRPAPEDHAACASPRLVIDDQGRLGGAPARATGPRRRSRWGRGAPEAQRAGAPDLGSAARSNRAQRKSPAGAGLSGLKLLQLLHAERLNFSAGRDCISQPGRVFSASRPGLAGVRSVPVLHRRRCAPAAAALVAGAGAEKILERIETMFFDYCENGSTRFFAVFFLVLCFSFCDLC